MAAPTAQAESTFLSAGATRTAPTGDKIENPQNTPVASKRAPHDLPSRQPTTKVTTAAPKAVVDNTSPGAASAHDAPAPTTASPSGARPVVHTRLAPPPEVAPAPVPLGEAQIPSAGEAPARVDSLHDGKDGARPRSEGRHDVASKGARGAKSAEPQQSTVPPAEAASPPMASNQAPPAPPLFQQSASGHAEPAPAASRPSPTTSASGNELVATSVRRSAAKLAGPVEEHADEDRDASRKSKSKAESATSKDASAAATVDAHAELPAKDVVPPTPPKAESPFKLDATRSVETAPGAAPIPPATSHSSIPTPIATSPDTTTIQPNTATFAMPSGTSTLLPVDYAIASPVSESHAALLDRAHEDPGLAVTVLPHAAHLSIASASGELALHVRVRDGNADVNVSGSMAPMFEAKAPEVRAVLAGEGLNLGSFATDQHGGHGQGHGHPEAEPAAREHHLPAAPRRSTPATAESAHPSDTGIHVTA